MLVALRWDISCWFGVGVEWYDVGFDTMVGSGEVRKAARGEKRRGFAWKGGVKNDMLWESCWYCSIGKFGQIKAEGGRLKVPIVVVPTGCGK